MPKRILWLCLLLLTAAGRLHAAETIPPAPARYFNDYALKVRPETAARLNQKLEDFERTSSSQLIAVIFPKMLSASSVQDYTLRVSRAWKVGQKNNSGAVLFVFLDNHKIWIQTGYGLEGALPDAICKDIISDRISPLFKQGDFDGGMTAGVEAMMQAAKGEYKGTGATNYERGHRRGSREGSGGVSFLVLLVIIGFFVFSRVFRGGGLLLSGMGPTYFGGFGSSGSSDRSSGGGGGSFGGGGAGGDW